MTHHVRPAHQVVVVRTYVHARNSLSKHICVAFIGSLRRARRVLLGGEGARSRERERERLACCSWRESLDYSNNPQQQQSSSLSRFPLLQPALLRLTHVPSYQGIVVRRELTLLPSWIWLHVSNFQFPTRCTHLARKKTVLCEQKR